MADLSKSMQISAAGMKVQSARLRVVSENMANANSTGQFPGDTPYRRKTISFENEFNRALDTNLVDVKKYGVDKTEFPLQYEPGHPAANAEGFVQQPNVNTMMEMMDMREARRSYEANLNMVETAKGMLQSTIGMLKE